MQAQTPTLDHHSLHGAAYNIPCKSGEIRKCIPKPEGSSIMNKVSLAKGVCPFSVGSLRVKPSSTSHHGSCVRKEESSLLHCSRGISWWESSEAVESEESPFKIISWWLGLTKLKDGRKLWDEDHWWWLHVMNFLPQGKGDVFQRAGSGLEWTFGGTNDLHKSLSLCYGVKSIFELPQ